MALQPILKIDRERVYSSIHAHEHYLKIPRAVPLPVCVRTCAFGFHLYRQTTEAHAHAGSLDIWNNAIVRVPVRRCSAALTIQRMTEVVGIPLFPLFVQEYWVAEGIC